MLDQDAKTELLSVARLTLESYLTRRLIPEYRPISEQLNNHRGAFVSIHKADDLRGCIGQLAPDEELYLVVQSCVLNAALNDYRFAPVTADELPELKIEISVLEPFQAVTQVEQIEIGKHGLMITRGGNRGVLLPQVAAEYQWDPKTFLAQTCRKAGLPEDAWQDERTQVLAFEAQVFSE